MFKHPYRQLNLKAEHSRELDLEEIPCQSGWKSMGTTILTSILKAIWCYLAVFVNALWVGGFTIYTAVVLRVGSRVVGGLEQGHITQKVTGILHWFALAVLITAALDVLIHWVVPTKKLRIARCVVLVLMSVALFSLFPLHSQMSGLMEGVGFVKPDTELFFPMHQRYQSIITLFWLGSVVELGFLLSTHRAGARQRS